MVSEKFNLSYDIVVKGRGETPVLLQYHMIDVIYQIAYSRTRRSRHFPFVPAHMSNDRS